MKGKIEFREKLNGILTLAEEADRQITIEEVENYFEEDNLSKEQLDLVFDYLLSQKIVVKGYTKTGGTVTSGEEEEEKQEEKITFTAEEQAYLKEYAKDLEAMKPEAEGEREALYGQAAAGDALAQARLVELYLKEVVEIAKEMHHPEVFLGDLVQEGNVGLLLGVAMIENVENAHEELLTEIRHGMQMLIEEQTELKDYDRKMVEKVNELDESIKTLTEDLGRKVTIDELALYMGITEEEVEDILRLAGEEPDEDGEGA